MTTLVFPLAIISLLTPICLVAVSTSHSTQASASQQLQDRVRKEVHEACPVTKPSGHPFVPPPPYRTDPRDGFWYGTESLWTLLAVQGTWNIHSNVLEEKGGDRTKLVYWRKGFDWRREPQPDLIVIAKRLDREAPQVAADPARAVFVTTERPGMMTGIDIPSTGCWELTAQYRGHQLSFVVLIQP